MKTNVRTALPEQIIAKGQPETANWFWSPSVFWRFEGNAVRVGGALLGGLAPGLFPEFYFLAQQGARLEAFRQAFPSVPRQELDSILDGMIRERVLVDALLSLPEAFLGQKSLFQHDHGDSLLFDAVRYKDFKQDQLRRPPLVETVATVTLNPGAWEVPAAVANRRSHRKFDPQPVLFEVFSRALSVFRTVERDGDPHRYYPTTGGLCGMDVYVAVKQERVSQIPGGVYFYNPRQNSLHPVQPKSGAGKEIHHHTNRAWASASAFTLFLVFNADVTMPVYGPAAYPMACVEAGIMLATFNHTAETLNLGVCAIGLVDFDRAEASLGLKPTHKLLHVAECGLKPNAESAVQPRQDTTTAPAIEPKAPATPTVSDLRRFLSETLPDYMVPSDFLLVDSIPLTANNKVDREALLRMAPAETLGLGTTYVPPESELEEAVLAIWRKLIRGRDVGVEDNFFDLGGDSMGVAEAHREILERFQVDLPIVKLFQYPTVRSTARFLRSQLQAQPGTEPAPAVPSAKPETNPVPCPAPVLDEQDRAALAWLKANPQHPRSAAVAAKLKSLGLL